MYSSVGGGSGNGASSPYSTVAGGYGNGSGNGMGASYTTVGGGISNSATADDTTVGGGHSNAASGLPGATVAGGTSNVASGPDTTVCGGYKNAAMDIYSTVGGGTANTAGDVTFSVSSMYTTVGGGVGNTASADNATVGGGTSNEASGASATVAGGDNNTASGQWSTIPGGQDNVADHANSFAAGNNANSMAVGAFTWADSVGTPVINGVDNRTWFKNAGGFLISTTTVESAAAFAVDSLGKVKIARYVTQDKGTDPGAITVNASDFGTTFTSTGTASTTAYQLPAVTAADIGAQVTFVKLGPGKVTILAAAGTYIADSGAGGTIYDDSATETYATLILRLTTSTMWVIMGGDGFWTVTN